MVQELFGNILDGINTNFRHIANARPEMLLVTVAGIALVGYFLLKGK